MISGEDYLYSNPKLDTFGKIDPGKEYSMRFIPMLGSKPAVELCKDVPQPSDIIQYSPYITLSPGCYENETGYENSTDLVAHIQCPAGVSPVKER
jgi:hypothetical protein